MLALVLGGSGFIGCHVVRALLNEEISVRVMSRTSRPTLCLQGIEHERVLGDLDDVDSLQKAMKGCQALFHVAGFYPIYSLNQKKQKLRAQKQVQNVLEAAGRCPTLKKIVYTSSLSTIGIPENGLATEQTAYREGGHHGLYYQIKYEMEQQVLQAAASGIPITIVNPTAVFGDWDTKPTSGIFIIHIAKEKWPFIIDAKINAVDVVDVAQAQVAALHQGGIGERYILGGHNTTVWELAQRIARVAHSKPPLFKLPLLLGESVAYTSEWIGKYLLKRERPPVPRVGMEFLRNGGHFDSGKAKKELNLHTTPLDGTLESALHWFQHHGYL